MKIQGANVKCFSIAVISQVTTFELHRKSAELPKVSTKITHAKKVGLD